MIKLQQLGDLQMAVLRTLWKMKEGSVAQVHAALKPDRDLAVTTVATVLSRLEKQGLITHYANNRQFVYQPRCSRADLLRFIIQAWADRLFHGNKNLLISHLLDASDVTPADVKRMRDMVETKNKRRRRG